MAHPRNSRVVTRRTYVRDLPYNKLRELSRLLDPAGNLDWKAMAELMPEYSAAEIGLFQMAYMRPGGSPTMDLLHDWGSRNRTVGNLVDLFKKMNHPVAANIVLPGSMPSVVNALPNVSMVSSSRPQSDHHNGDRPSAMYSLATSHPSGNARGHQDHNTASQSHHYPATIGPCPTSPPTSVATFPYSYEQVIHAPTELEPVVTTIEVQQSEYLQPFHSAGYRPPIPASPMGIPVTSETTRKPPSSIQVAMSDVGTGTAGGIVSTENVEERRKLLAKAAESRRTAVSGITAGVASMTLVGSGPVSNDSDSSNYSNSSSGSSSSSSTQPSEFSYEILQQVTSNFRELPLYSGGMKLGSGSFGSVYLGELLIKGQQQKVAVKRLLKQNNDKESEVQLKEQFRNELYLLAEYCHENLVLLLGYAIDGPEFCLIYEYMNNGSLMDNLACLNGKGPLDSKTRLSVAVGCARALAFLHDQKLPLVHRDVKSSNVLLDENMIAKLSDFGIARVLEPVGDATQGATQRTTRVQGTLAYLAPEASRGTITVKMDAFALGIVFYELLTGLRPFDESRESQDLKSHIEDQLDAYDGDKLKLLDPIARWPVDIAMLLWEISDSLTVERKNQRKSVCDVLPHIEQLV